MSSKTERSLLDQGKSSKFLFTFFISFAIAKAFGLAFTKIFTNVLSQQEMGQYYVILSATSLIMSFAALGIPMALSRYAIRYKTKNQIQNLRDFIFSGFICFIIVELLIIIGFIIYYFVTQAPPPFFDLGSESIAKTMWDTHIGLPYGFVSVSDNYIIFLFLVAAIVVAQFFSTICFTTASSLQNSRYYAIIVIMRVLLQIPFGILFTVFLDFGVFGLIAGLAISEFSVAMYSAYRIIKDIGIGRFSISELKKLFEFGLPIYASGILWYFFDLAILVYIKMVEGNASGDVTISLYRYGALTVVNLVLLAGNVFGLVYRPVIYKFFENDQFKDMEIFTVRIMKLFMILFFPFISLLFAFSPWLIQFFTNAEYITSIPIIPILLFAILFQYIQIITTYGHTLYMKNYWSFIGGVISFILTCTVAYFLIPINGLLGIAVAYFTRRVTYLIIFHFVSQHYFKIKFKWLQTLLILFYMGVAGGIGAVLYFYAFPFIGLWNYTASFTISAIIFALLVLVSKFITKGDVKFLTGLFKSYIEGIRGTKQDLIPEEAS